MNKQTKFGLSSGDKKIIIVGGVLIGLILGLLLAPIWSVIDQFEWIPFHGPLSALMSVDGQWISITRPVVLTLVGLGVASVIIATSPKITISNDEILIEKGSDKRTIKKSQVDGVYIEQSKLVIMSVKGRQLYKGDVEGKRQHVAETFQKYGYPWES